MLDTELAWVAGLLEGEGCFYMKATPRPHAYIKCVMTDEDVIRRLHQLVGKGSVSGPMQSKTYINRKPTWGWSLGRDHGLEDFLKDLLPYMGERRKQKIEEILAVYAVYQGRPEPQHGTRYMYEGRRCRCKLCRAYNAERSRNQRIKQAHRLDLIPVQPQ